MQDVTQSTFVKNLIAQAEANPIAAMAVAAALFTGVSKIIEASGHAVGSRAYARDVDRRVRNARR